MNCQQTPGGLLVTGITDFSLPETLDCGQCFRWQRLESGAYRGSAYGKSLTVSMDEKGLLLQGAAEEDFQALWRSYFDLDLDYNKIRGALANKDPILKEAAAFAPGIRILNQEPFETLCSFIISQNNNIPRIKGIIERLCLLFERETGSADRFPTAEMLACRREEDLAPLRAGWRAAYLLDAAQKVAGGEIDLERIKALPMPEARAELMRIKGVGPKVAECVLLYGLHRLEAFPMDVWMKRAMATLFPEKSVLDFGPYAGIAQQYILHYSRLIRSFSDKKSRQQHGQQHSKYTGNPNGDAAHSALRFANFHRLAGSYRMAGGSDRHSSGYRIFYPARCSDSSKGASMEPKIPVMITAATVTGDDSSMLPGNLHRDRRRDRLGQHRGSSAFRPV